MEGLGTALLVGLIVAIGVPASIGFAVGRGKGALIGGGAGAAAVFGYSAYKRAQSQKQMAAFDACVQSHRAAAPQTRQGQAAAFTQCQVIFGIISPAEAANIAAHNA